MYIHVSNIPSPRSIGWIYANASTILSMRFSDCFCKTVFVWMRLCSTMFSFILFYMMFTMLSLRTQYKLHISVVLHVSVSTCIKLFNVYRENIYLFRKSNKMMTYNQQLICCVTQSVDHHMLYILYKSRHILGRICFTFLHWGRLNGADVWVGCGSPEKRPIKYSTQR